MGRFGAVDCSCGASPDDDRIIHSPPGVRSDGTLAGLDRDRSYRSRNLAPLAKVHPDRKRYLSSLLAPLDPHPEELATRLLDHFGSIAAIARASEDDLRQLSPDHGRWLEAFLAVRQLLHDGIREELVRTPLGSNREALVRHFYRSLNSLPEERLICVFGDRNGFFLSEEVLAIGATQSLTFTSRKIFGRALSLDARQIVLAHNHPSGCANPSECDIRHTRRLAEQAQDLGIKVEDHFVVGSRAVVSMKSRGLF